MRWGEFKEFVNKHIPDDYDIDGMEYRPGYEHSLLIDTTHKTVEFGFVDAPYESENVVFASDNQS